MNGLNTKIHYVDVVDGVKEVLGMGVPYRQMMLNPGN